MNTVIITGRVVREPDIQMSGELVFTNFRVKVRSEHNGSRPTWVNVTKMEPESSLKIVANNLREGSVVTVRGSLRSKSKSIQVKNPKTGKTEDRQMALIDIEAQLVEIDGYCASGSAEKEEEEVDWKEVPVK